MDDKVLTYKGTDKNMQCRGFQFEIGKEYEAEGNIEVCQNGFHGCEVPLDCFRYYPPGASRYFSTEQSGDISRDNDGSKIASRKIKIGAEIGIPGLIKAHVEYVKSAINRAKNNLAGGDRANLAGGDSANLAGGYWANLAGGDSANLAGGDGANLAGGNWANLAGGDSANLAGGVSANLAGGDWANLAGGDWANLAGGNLANLAGGDRANLVSRHKASTGKNGVAVVRGNDIKARGGLGAVLVFAVENDNLFGLKEWKAVVVDGETIKANVWYTLKDGAVIATGEE